MSTKNLQIRFKQGTKPAVMIHNSKQKQVVAEAAAPGQDPGVDGQQRQADAKPLTDYSWSSGWIN